jgi:hypothetical protein
MSNSAMNIATAAQCLEFYIGKNIPVMLSGAPGLGKSQIVHQIAAKLGIPVKDIRASRLDPVDLHGIPVPDLKAGRTIWLTPAMLPDEKRDGKRGILFLDELPDASDAMQKALYGLVLERRLGDYKLPDGWVPVAAGNRRIDRTNTRPMGSALRNRFAHVEVSPDLQAWTLWANKAGISPWVMAFARYRPELLHKMPDNDTQNAFPTPRAWESVSKLGDDMPDDLRYLLVAGLVGEGAAGEFAAFMSVNSKLPDLDAILDGSYKDKLDSKEISIYYALATALARRCDKTTFGTALAYLTANVPGEFEVLFVVDAAKRDEAIMKTRAFNAWAIKNQSVIL